jgi:hypothetical protein
MEGATECLKQSEHFLAGRVVDMVNAEPLCKKVLCGDVATAILFF